MRKLIALLLLLSTITSFAQQDSTWIDMGRVQLRKTFIQGITIKAAQLEKLPFASLSDVVRTWFYGTYSGEQNLVWSVDGNLTADVNWYNIYDIEEITLVQNATSQLNGAFNQELLVVVKTKRGHQKTGLRVAAQAHAVKREFHSYILPEKRKSDAGLYHKYNLAAVKKTLKASYGLSAGLVRDIFPNIAEQGLKVYTPNHINRFQVNTYFAYAFNSHHHLMAGVDLLTAPGGYEVSGTDPNTFGDLSYYQDRKDKGLNGNIAFTSRFGNHIENKVKASFTTLHYDLYNNLQQNQGSVFYLNIAQEETKTQNLSINNTTRLHYRTGNLKFSPALTVTYNKLKEKVDQFSANNQTISFYQIKNKGNKFLVTPSLDVVFKDRVNIQAGAVTDLSKSSYKTFYPYANLSARLIGNGDTGFGWKVFSSYAQSNFFLDHHYRLSSYSFNGNYFYGVASPFVSPFFFMKPDSNFSNIQAGTELAWGKLSLNYTYERRDFMTMLYINIAGGGTNIDFPEVISKSHLISLGGTVLDKGHINWFTRISANSIQYFITGYDNNTTYEGSRIIGDESDWNRSWTGGWVNRFRFKNFTLGADLLYHKGYSDLYYIGPDLRRSMLSLQNVFIGYRLGKKMKEAEIYLSARNLVSDQDYSMIMDNRRFIGGGFKLEL